MTPANAELQGSLAETASDGRSDRPSLPTVGSDTPSRFVREIFEKIAWNQSRKDWRERFGKAPQ